jgi:hypothetical protein
MIYQKTTKNLLMLGEILKGIIFPNKGFEIQGDRGFRD